MKQLRKKEIYNLMRPNFASNASISVTPFNNDSLKEDGYELHAEGKILIENGAKHEFSVIPNEGLLLSPRFVYTFKTLEKVKTKGIIPCVVGTGVVRAERLENDHYMVRVSPLVPYVLDPKDSIATMKFFIVDDLHSNTPEKAHTKSGEKSPRNRFFAKYVRIARFNPKQFMGR